MTAVELLNLLSASGIVLKGRDGRLLYDAPLGTLTAELKEALRSHKPELIRLLATQGRACRQYADKCRQSPGGFRQGQLSANQGVASPDADNADNIHTPTRAPAPADAPTPVGAPAWSGKHPQSRHPEPEPLDGGEDSDAENRSADCRHFGPLTRPWPPRPLELGTWPAADRERWGRRTNEIEDTGLSWRDAERQAFLEVSAERAAAAAGGAP